MKKVISFIVVMFLVGCGAGVDTSTLQSIPGPQGPTGASGNGSSTGSGSSSNNGSGGSSSGSNGSNGSSGSGSSATPSPTPSPVPNGTFKVVDTVTEGSWKGKYGANGYTLHGDGTNLPSYVTVSILGSQDFTWAYDTTDVRALQKVGGLDRVASCWFNQTFDVEVAVTDGNAYTVSLYLLDWDSNYTRVVQVDAYNMDTGLLMNSKTISDYMGGQYLSWTVSGKVRFKLTSLGQLNAVVSGIFIDP